MSARSPLPIAVKKERSLLFSTLSTFGSLIPTAYAALISNSVILRADFLRCAVEFAAIVVSWIIVRRIGRGDRAQFNYGFGKFEQIAGMLVGLAMFITFAVMLFSCVRRFVLPEPVDNGFFGFVLGILSVLGNVAVWGYNRRLAKVEPSPLLEAQWRLFRAKTCASIVVVLSLACSLMGGASPLWLYADPLGSLILSGFILFSGIGLVSASMHDLVDGSIEEALQIIILRMLVQHESRYTGLGAIKTRRAGADVMVEITLEFDGGLTLAEIHRRTEEMKKDLAAKIGGAKVIIFPAPYSV